MPGSVPFRSAAVYWVPAFAGMTLEGGDAEQLLPS
jgi:hypothetical protein